MKFRQLPPPNSLRGTTLPSQVETLTLQKNRVGSQGQRGLGICLRLYVSGRKKFDPDPLAFLWKLSPDPLQFFVLGLMLELITVQLSMLT